MKLDILSGMVAVKRPIKNVNKPERNRVKHVILIFL